MKHVFVDLSTITYSVFFSSYYCCYCWNTANTFIHEGWRTGICVST